jgi:hypothetical protein
MPRRTNWALFSPEAAFWIPSKRTWSLPVSFVRVDAVARNESGPAKYEVLDDADHVVVSRGPRLVVDANDGNQTLPDQL